MRVGWWIGGFLLFVAILFLTVGEVGAAPGAMQVGGEVDVYGLDLATGNGGEVYLVDAARFSFQDRLIRVHVSTDSGQTFGPWTNLSVSNASMIIKDPKVAVGSSGQVLVTWVELSGNMSEIHGSISIDSGDTWFTSFPISTSIEVGNFWGGSALVADPGAGFIIVYRAQNPNGSTDIMATRSAPSGLTWTPPVRVSDSRVNNRSLPGLAVATDGRLHVVWTDGRLSPPPVSCGQPPCVPSSMDTDIYASYSNDSGSSWSPDVRVSGYTANNYHAKPLAYPNGTVCVVWDYALNFLTDTLHMRHRCLDADQVPLGPWVSISDIGLTDADQQPDLVFDPATGRTLVAYSGLSGATSFEYRILLAGRSDWENISGHRVIADFAGEEPQFRPELALGPEGQIFVAWQDYRLDLKPRLFLQVIAPSILPVHAGWNLLGVPFDISGDFLDVLESDYHGTTWDKVFAFDGSWYSIDKNAPAYMWAPIPVSAGMGFWLHVLGPMEGSISFRGVPGPAPPVPLAPGWNLVGTTNPFPQTVLQAMQGIERESIWGYDFQGSYLTKELGEGAEMRSGEGFWIPSLATQYWDP